MWFKVEDKRRAKGNKYLVRCATEIGGKSIMEERSAQGAPAARKTAELRATSLNTSATVYGTDAEGEFVFRVYEIAERASDASSPIIKRLYAESAAASLSFKDEMLGRGDRARPRIVAMRSRGSRWSNYPQLRIAPPNARHLGAAP
jgi:hypothetical protein